MAFHDVSVTNHSILDQGQVLCISKILNYQPPPTSHILNNVHQQRPATERIHRCTDTWWKLLLVYVLWEICEYCMTMRGNTQARAHTHRAHILHATCIAAYQYPWLGRIWRQVWISFGNPTNRHILLRFLEYEYELVNHLRLWEDSTKHTLENIAQPKEDVAMPLTCVSRRNANENGDVMWSTDSFKARPEAAVTIPKSDGTFVLLVRGVSFWDWWWKHDLWPWTWLFAKIILSNFIIFIYIHYKICHSSYYILLCCYSSCWFISYLVCF